MNTALTPTPNRNPLAPAGRWLARHRYSLQVVAGIAAFGMVSSWMLQGSGNPDVRFRLDLSPILSARPVLQVHVVAALSAFTIGAVLLAGIKGNLLHRALGYAWLAMMATTAITSFFITGLNGDAYSLIHFLSGWTLIGLPMGLAAARRHDLKSHRKHMMGMFTGAMLIAGLFTFLPGRLMWSLFFTV